MTNKGVKVKQSVKKSSNLKPFTMQGTDIMYLLIAQVMLQYEECWPGNGEHIRCPNASFGYGQEDDQHQIHRRKYKIPDYGHSRASYLK